MADEKPLPVAVCAPGSRAQAGAILAAHGDEVREVREHPWLEGYEGVLVFADPEEIALEPPFAFSFTARPSLLDRYLELAALRQPPIPGSIL